jgi:hypothetical protein
VEFERGKMLHVGAEMPQAAFSLELALQTRSLWSLMRLILCSIRGSHLEFSDPYSRSYLTSFETSTFELLELPY